MSDEEFEAIKTTAKYEFYKKYVEHLEKDYDELKEKYNVLIRKFKNYVPHDNTDLERLRNQNILLKKKNDNLLNLIYRRNEEIEELKKKIERLK